MRIKCLAQGHYCRCQQIRIGDLMAEIPWSYPLSHNSWKHWPENIYQNNQFQCKNNFKALPVLRPGELTARTSPPMPPWCGGASPCLMETVIGIGCPIIAGPCIMTGLGTGGVVAIVTPGGITVAIGVA